MSTLGGADSQDVKEMDGGKRTGDFLLCSWVNLTWYMVNYSRRWSSQRCVPHGMLIIHRQELIKRVNFAVPPLLTYDNALNESFELQQQKNRKDARPRPQFETFPLQGCCH